MREFNALHAYDRNSTERVVAGASRCIKNRLVATERGRDYYDGDRANGFGGFRYDGRWRPVAKSLIADYDLSPEARVLHIGCDKGFLLQDLLVECSTLQVAGLDPSVYAIDAADASVRKCLVEGPFRNLPFADKSFDLVICSGPIYTLDLAGAVGLLREVCRVTSRSAYVTLAAYEDQEDFFLFRDWSLLASTVLLREEWEQVLKFVDYRYDYSFMTSELLKLKRPPPST